MTPQDQNDTFAEKLEATNTPKVHPIFNVHLGTTAAELACMLHAQEQSERASLVPHGSVVVDSMPYENVINRLVQNGWSKEFAEEAIPRSHFLELKNPFGADFDFNNQLNKDWQRVIFDPTLIRAASNPDAPGCAGTPAFGRARVEANREEISAFFERHIRDLISVRDETLNLCPGVFVFLITTARGGTGTGAAARVGALLRPIVPQGKVHLINIMPDVFGGDDRAHANAYAQARELQHYHRFGGFVPMKNGEEDRL